MKEYHNSSDTGVVTETANFLLIPLKLPDIVPEFLKKKGGIPLAIVVDVQDNLEKALRVLKKKMQLDGLQRELKNRRFYEKPSVKRRRKMQEAERRRRKARRRRRR